MDSPEVVLHLSALSIFLPFAKVHKGTAFNLMCRRPYTSAGGLHFSLLHELDPVVAQGLESSFEG